MSTSSTDNPNLLHGACACERNQYTIFIPPTSISLAQVYFDNSAANRRAQATPLTAWLRIPLAWYSSATIARFPDESHGSIKRTFAQSPEDVRRQFCGYCGTHLTAWDEGEDLVRRRTEENQDKKEDDDDGGGWLNVTVGSLLGESLERLEDLGLVGGEDEEEDDDDHDNDEEDDDDDGNGDDEENNSTAATTSRKSGKLDDPATTTTTTTTSPAPTPAWVSHRMRNRGVPFFETMMDGSALGRIRRHRSGQHRSSDGRTTVQWEVIEMDDGGDAAMADAGAGDDAGRTHHTKRQKTSA